MLRAIYTHCCTDAVNPTYVVEDKDPTSHRGVQLSEAEMLFGDARPTQSTHLGLMHNDTQPSNIIVDKDRIVGLVDWEMAGFFDWNVAKKVHEEFRTPRRENFKNLNVSEEWLNDVLYWNDLYRE